MTRLCLDQLKSVRHQRETYIGPWLPDPIVEEEEEDITPPLMLALARLSPLERGAFQLHVVRNPDKQRRLHQAVRQSWRRAGRRRWPGQCAFVCDVIICNFSI